MLCGFRREGKGASSILRKEITFSLFSCSLHHIDGSFEGLFGDSSWRSTSFYEWHVSSKHLSLELFYYLQNDFDWERPCLCVGDFNQILYNEEKLGGLHREQKFMDEFKAALNSCGFLDLGYVDFPYTWWNGCDGKKKPS